MSAEYKYKNVEYKNLQACVDYLLEFDLHKLMMTVGYLKSKRRRTQDERDVLELAEPIVWFRLDHEEWD